MGWRDVPIPDSMKHLPKDHRGLPIPFVVLRDRTGKAHFTINDSSKVRFCAEKDRCHISGLPLQRGRWFVGGPLSALHEHGAYGDGPLRYDCLHYALQVCPYLAARSYTGRLDDITLDKEANPGLTTVMDTTTIPERPVLFVAVMCLQHQMTIRRDQGDKIYFKPERPYRRMMFWQHGEQLPDDLGAQRAEEVLGHGVPELQAMKVKQL